MLRRWGILLGLLTLLAGLAVATTGSAPQELTSGQES